MDRTVSLLAGGLLLAALAPARLPAQSQFEVETDLVAKRRLFESVGPGFRAIRRGPNGNYYVLTAPAAAVEIYDAAGKRVGQVPNEAAAAGKGAALVYGESFDVDAAGRVAVCDRGANAVKIYSADGSLSQTIPVSGPASLVLLPGSEVAVASATAPRLINVYDLGGKLIREYGDPEEITDNADVNRQANLGHLAADQSSNTYFAFEYLPEPTVRKFDRAGYLTLEISLTALEFEGAAQSARRALARSTRGSPVLHRIITGIGVDPQTQQVWMAVGTLLMRFDKDGQRLASFRTYTPGGARIESSAILVEPDRLLIGADPQGIYEFPRPEKPVE